MRQAALPKWWTVLRKGPQGAACPADPREAQQVGQGITAQQEQTGHEHPGHLTPSPELSLCPFLQETSTVHPNILEND